MNKIRVAFFGLIFLIFFGLIYFLSYNLIEPKVYDFLIKNISVQKLPFHNKQVYGSDDIVLIVIDDKTTSKYRWPWRRDLNCKVYKYLREYAKPSVFVHDTLLTSSDVNNPAADKIYFEEIKKHNNLITGFFAQPQKYENVKLGNEFDNIFKKFALKSEDTSTSYNKLFNSIMLMPDEYIKAQKYVGAVNVVSGFINGNLFIRDEVCRTQLYFVKYKNEIYPSLSLRTFLIKKGTNNIKINDKAMIFPELNYKVNHKTNIYYSFVPIKFYKRYPSTSYSHKYYSALDIMDSYDSLKQGKQPIVNPEEFKDKIVVFGANVIGGESLNDNKNSSITSRHPGVDIQATAIDNLLHNDFLKIIPMWVNVLITIIGMLCVYIIVRFYELSKSIAYLFYLLILFNLFIIICYYFNIIVAVIPTNFICIITTILAFMHKFILENNSKEKVKSAMGKYMSQDVMKRIVMNIDNLGLGGKKSVVTVLFSDIRGFTSMSEKMSAQEVSEILNEYFTEMEPIITKYNGIINKFIGDAVMAIFGEPIQDNNHPINAVKCGYEMLLKVKELQKKWELEGKPKIDIGIGINTGEVFVGNIGSVNRMEYTVIGDTVNLASRLESYNKIYKTKMLISSSTFEKTKNILDAIKISDVEIRGKEQKINIYEVLKVIEF